LIAAVERVLSLTTKRRVFASPGGTCIRKNEFSDTQSLAILKDGEAGAPVAELVLDNRALRAVLGESAESPAPRFLWTPRSNPFSWFQEVSR